MFHVEEKPSQLYVRADVAARLVESTDGVLARYVDTDSALRERRARVSALRKQEDREADAPWLPLGLVKALRAALERAWEQVRDHSDHQGVYGFGVQHTGSEYRLHVASELGLEAVVTSAMKREAGDIRPVLRREWRHALPGDALSDPLQAALVERFESEIAACGGVRRSRLSSIQAP